MTLVSVAVCLVHTAALTCSTHDFTVILAYYISSVYTGDCSLDCIHSKIVVAFHVTFHEYPQLSGAVLS